MLIICIQIIYIWGQYVPDMKYRLGGVIRCKLEVNMHKIYDGNDLQLSFVPNVFILSVVLALIYYEFICILFICSHDGLYEIIIWPVWKLFVLNAITCEHDSESGGPWWRGRWRHWIRQQTGYILVLCKINIGFLL